ncbi:lipopolysaccharide biosynthesis protein [Vibrio breoganii]|uniref:Lipopolysaccharide biosynthesis protein n=1 Tax=Vibrio breoganii TaxID=553239 RepID=A0ABX1UAF9_9VIBR|nr:lipopolysaccharide biosynthesis protein [Vibrio breoganii]NMO74819.1 lipopolysaccharide biosynthesis protein [Vibrio breoganii]NMR71458.1 lipopolysaccharide biosynthesis protein [Vibrio breoganii]PML84904.1 hypothetical protein BCT67_15625 [Vibrio breoganii]
MSTLKHKAINATKWNIIDIVLSNAINFLSIIYLANILKPKDFGLLAVLAVMTSLANVIINSGFFQALVHKGKEITNDDCKTVFTVNILISTSLYSILVLSSELIANFYESIELKGIIYVLFTSIIFNSVTVVHRAKLSIDMNFSYQAKINVIASLVSSITGMWLGYIGFGYWALVSIILTKSIVCTILYSVSSEWKIKFGFCYKSFKELFSYGSKLFLASIINTITLNLSNLIIGKLFSIKELGYYNQAQSYSNLLSNNIVAVTQKVTFPLFSSIKNDRKRVRSIYEQILTISTFISVPIVIGFASISNEFVLVFLNESWRPAVDLLAILCVAKSISPISMFNINLISALGNSGLVLKIDTLKMVLAVGVIYVTSKISLNAVAMGQVLLSLVFYVMNAIPNKKHIGLGLFNQIKIIYKIYLSASIMYIINTSFHLDCVYLSMFIKVVLGIFVYISSCYLLKVNVLRNLYWNFKNRA